MPNIARQLYPVVWSRRQKTIEVSLAYSLFTVLLIALTIAWLALVVVEIDASTVQSHLDGLITFEVTVLAVLIAGLGITITLAANQTTRLDHLRPILLGHLRDPQWAPILDAKAAQFESYIADPRRDRSRISSFRSDRVKDVNEQDVKKNYIDLAAVATGASAGAELEANTAQLFKAAVSALLCPTWLDSDDPITPLSKAIQKLDVEHGVVDMVNRTYDMRTAARRGLPILSFVLAFSLAATLVASVIPIQHEPQRWFVKGVTLPIFPIAYFLSFYSYLIPVQYISS